MLTSSNGNIFRVSGPLCGEFTGPLTKASDAELWCFSLICTWINGWVNNREAGDLRRHRVHYGVTVMWTNIIHSDLKILKGLDIFKYLFYILVINILWEESKNTKTYFNCKWIWFLSGESQWDTFFNNNHIDIRDLKRLPELRGGCWNTISLYMCSELKYQLYMR